MTFHTARLLLVALAWSIALPALAQSGTLARIQRDQTIVIGYATGAAPFSSVEGSGPPQGYSADICRAVAESVGAQLKTPLKTRWVALTTQERQEAVRTKRVDLECGTTTWTLTRQAEVDFSLIIFVDGANVLSRTDGGAGRIAEFAGKRIAVMPATTTEKVLRETLAREKVKAEVLIVPSRAEGVKLLEDGKVDGFASDRTTLIGAIAPRADRNRFKLMDVDLSVEPYALMLARDDQDFRVAVNRAIARLYRSGEILKIYERWLGPLGAPSLLLNATYFLQGIPE
jgi:glutamate/aspartate transport system substrate-binding protein